MYFNQDILYVRIMQFIFLLFSAIIKMSVSMESKTWVLWHLCFR